MKSINYALRFTVGLFFLLGSITSRAQNDGLTDLALKKKATEKAVRAVHVADWAVDGDDKTSAIVDGSVGAWWQVDLGARYEINKVKINNKWPADLKSFYVLFSDNPFPENTEIDLDQQTLAKYCAGMLDINKESKGFDLDVQPAIIARYVRIQRKPEGGSTNMDLISVNVLGKPQQVSGGATKEPWLVNLAFGKKATQLSVVDGNGAAGAIDANPATASISKGAACWWQVDLGDNYKISNIKINLKWPNDLNNFYLRFFDKPIPENTSLNFSKKVLAPYTVRDMAISEKGKDAYDIKLEPDVTARYVRIQRKREDGTGNMDLRKVEIIGNATPVSNHTSQKLSLENFKPVGIPYDGVLNPKPDVFGMGRGPYNYAATYRNGKLILIWQDQLSGKQKFSRYSKTGATFKNDFTKDIPNSLDKLAGFTFDETNYFLLTMVNENWNKRKGWEFRPNVVHLIKLDGDGNVIWNKDLNREGYHDKIYDPLGIGSAGLAYAKDRIAIISASSVGDVDPAVGGRHEANFCLTVKATDGSPATKGSWFWARHGYDARVAYDGENFVFYDFGDQGFLAGCGLYASKNVIAENRMVTGNNHCVFTRAGNGNFSNMWMGDIRTGKNGYIAEFAAPNSISVIEQTDVRNLGIVHVVKDFEKLSSNTTGDLQKITKELVDTKTKNTNATDDEKYTTNLPKAIKNGEIQNTGIVWLTKYTDKTVGWPKLYKFSDDRYLALWEVWSTKRDPKNNRLSQGEYLSTNAMIVDEYGNIVKGETSLGKVRLPALDELFDMDGKGCWIDGDCEDLSLTLYSIDENLKLSKTTFDL